MVSKIEKIKTAFSLYLHMEGVQIEEVDKNVYSVNHETKGIFSEGLFFIHLDENNIWNFDGYLEHGDQELRTIFVHLDFDKCLIGGIREYQDAYYSNVLADIAERNYHELLEYEAI